MGIGESLYNGLSGLKCYSSGISVCSDNVANANTTGFKSNAIRFGDLVNSEYALRTNDAEGEGSGSMVLGIVTDFSQGTLIDTTTWSDMAIAGKGFFIVETPSEDDQGQTFYTRDGTFHMDKEGFLVNQQGYRVQGYQVTGQASTSTQIEGAAVTAAAGDYAHAHLNITSAASGLNLDVDLTAATGYADVVSAVQNAITAAGADAEISADTNTAGDGMSITTSNTDLAFAITDDGTATTLTTALLGLDGATTTSTTTDATFADDLTSIQISAPAGEPEYIDYYVTNEGVVTATDQDGVKHSLYKVGLAGFENENGLARNGANLYFIGPEINPENIIYNGGADGNPEYFGYVSDSCVEGSNVDIASEMVNMIVYQAGYNANSKSITTSSELLDVAINMIR